MKLNRFERFLLLFFMSSSMFGCGSDFTADDRKELVKLRAEIAELKALLSKNNSSNKKEIYNIEPPIDSVIIPPTNIDVANLSIEDSFKLKAYRNSFAIAKRIVKNRYPKSYNIEGGQPQFSGNGIVVQKVRFHSEKPGRILGDIEIDFRANPPFINKARFEERDYVVTDTFDAYELVSIADKN